MRPAALLLLAVVGSSGGCGTGGGSDDGGARTDLSTPAAAPDLQSPDAPTYTNVRLRLFSGCDSEGCHGVTTMNLGDRKTLINVAATASPNKVRIKPGDPDSSFLSQKVTNRLAAGEGDRMPPEGLPLSDGELGLLRAWIAAGALDD